ncbi:hypothetical protein [Neotabrizicola sp. VNH66]|uniref:hypothetical protein n=1 Tax=Neotabrizicola sp. VNH66 TaxID=3400918 RepID=UPI003C0C2A8E
MGRDSQERRRRRDAEAAPARLDPEELLGDIDAWNLREDGGWLRFDARLEDGARAYLRSRAGGDILADAPGPLYAILGIGGARRAGFNAGPPQFRFNVLAPADHIGAVGLEGTARAEPVSSLQHLPHRSREALVADHLLDLRYRDRRGLPLILTRAETDASASLGALSGGLAMANLVTALDNLCMAAETLGRPAQVLAVGLEFGAEDLGTDSTGFAEGIRALMTRLSEEMRRRGLAPPVYLACAENGDHPSTPAWWELAWCPGPHRLRITAPGYMAARDGFGRLTEAGRDMLAAMDAHALRAVEQGQDWLCPLPLLAEHRGAEIRVTFRALADLVVDAADLFGAGPAAGFALTGDPAQITGVAIAPDDPQVVVLTLDRPLTGTAARLRLAIGGPSTLRDTWAAGGLHRWALPADLPLHPQGTAP